MFKFKYTPQYSKPGVLNLEFYSHPHTNYIDVETISNTRTMDKHFVIWDTCEVDILYRGTNIKWLYMNRISINNSYI